jgi:hypothetical protein
MAFQPPSVGNTVEIAELESLTKGHIIAGDGSGAPTTLTPGSNDDMLVYDSAQTTGLKSQTPTQVRSILSVPTFDFDNANSVDRLRHSFSNFLSNASFEYWFAGTSTDPSAWTTQGSPGIARVSDPSVGTYAAQLTTNANDEHIRQVVTCNAGVSYTLSVFYKVTSGSGTISLVAQENGDDFTEYANSALDGGPHTEFQIARLTFTKPDDGTSQVRFKIGQSDATATATVVVIDECMFQEGSGVASAFLHNQIDDTSVGQNIFGQKVFWGGVKFAAPSAGGNAITIPDNIDGNALHIVDDTGGATLMRFKTANSFEEITLYANTKIDGAALVINGNIGFFNATAASKQTVTGAKGSNAALGSLLSALSTYGLITDSSSA